MDDAREHCARGASDLGVGEQRPTDGEPDVVLACAGDTPTLETVAAAWLLRRHRPGASRARRQRRRSDDAVLAVDPSARHDR